MRSNIEYEVPESAGVYIFWSKNFCVYVGQADNLRKRLLTHWSKSHNANLNIWLQSLGPRLCIGYELVSKDLTGVEQMYIDRYQPHLNKINARSK